MLNHRLQILLDEDRYQRVHELARSRGVPVAVVIREAIDRGLGAPGHVRRAAAARLRAAVPMEVPDDVEDLIKELDELRGRRGRRG